MTLKHEGSPVNPEGRSFGVHKDMPNCSTCADVAGFHPKPRRIARMKLSDRGKNVLAAMLFLARPEGEGLVCYASAAEIGEECGYSLNNVRQARRDLEAVGLVVPDVRKGGPSAPVVLLVDRMGRDIPAVEPLRMERFQNSKRSGSTPPNGVVQPLRMELRTPPNGAVPPIRESSELSESKTKTPQPPDGGRSGGGDSISSPGKAEDPGTEAQAVGREAIAQAKALKADPDCAKRIGLKARRAVEAGEAAALVRRTAEAVARQVAGGGRPGLVEKVWRETLEAEKLAGDAVPEAKASASKWSDLDGWAKEDWEYKAKNLTLSLRAKHDLAEGRQHPDALDFTEKAGLAYDTIRIEGRMYFYLAMYHGHGLAEIEGMKGDMARRAYLGLARAQWEFLRSQDDVARKRIEELMRSVRVHVATARHDRPEDEAERQTFDYQRISKLPREQRTVAPSAGGAVHIGDAIAAMFPQAATA